MFKKVVTTLIIIGLVFMVGGISVAKSETPGSMLLQGEYLVDGDIYWESNVGTDTTGGQRATLIEGQGSAVVVKDVFQEIGRLNVDEETIFETAANHMFDQLKIISATKANFDRTQATQIYGSYMSPEQGEFGYVSEVVKVTQDMDNKERKLYDTFYVGYEAELSEGIHRRYIDIAGEESETHMTDFLEVQGTTSIKEIFQFYDIDVPAAVAIDVWYDLF